jgi:starvation-inducible DNA-binding protein
MTTVSTKMKNMQKTSRHGDAELARGLSGLLADSYLLYNTTQTCHWNVEGPQFKPLHELFEEQYTELAEAIDTIAERVRALGFYTPGTLQEMLGNARVSQETGPADADAMLERLIAAHHVVVHRIKELQQAADAKVDEATLDLLVERQRVHEKAIWFLRSQAGQGSTELGETTLRERARVS